MMPVDTTDQSAQPMTDLIPLASGHGFEHYSSPAKPCPDCNYHTTYVAWELVNQTFHIRISCPRCNSYVYITPANW